MDGLREGREDEAIDGIAVGPKLLSGSTVGIGARVGAVDIVGLEVGATH